MANPCAKLAVIAALRRAPEFAPLVALPSLHTQAGRDFQRWLDWSGLALTFYRRLQQYNVTEQISKEWRGTLEQKLSRNAERVHDMVAEAQRLTTAFRSTGVTVVTLKGITLVPDFCDDICLRHQTDFDFLVSSRDIAAAAEALNSCGYSAPHLSESGETCFLTPSRHIPTAHDDLYSLQRHRQVDLHTSLWEPCSWLPVVTPEDCLTHARPEFTCGTEHVALSLEDKFLLQVLHAFRHSFRSWIRVSWLLEIGHCMTKHQDNVALWDRLIGRAGHTLLTKRIFALVTGIVHRLFEVPIPPQLQSWISVSMTPPMRVWLDHFATEWAISDWPGSLNNLFLTTEFIADPGLRRQYWRSRFLPKRVNTSLGSIATAGPRSLLLAQTARLSYVAKRTVAQLRDIVLLPRQQIRWKRALLSSRRIGFDSNY